MKKSLRIFTVIAVLSSSLLFSHQASAVSMGEPYDITTGNGDASCGLGDGFFSVSNYIITSSTECSGLVFIPNGITGIGNAAFSETNASYFIFPSSLETIGDDAFFEARNLTEVVIPDAVTSIGSYAFAGIPTLTSVRIGNGVTQIPVAAFQGAWGLTNLVFGNNITNIGDAAFNGARALTTVKIPNGVTYIGASAFANDADDPSALSTLVIPDSVEELGNNAFGGADVLTHISYCGSLLDMSNFFVAGLTTQGTNAYSCDTAPGSPTNVIVSTGTTTADISFAAPESNGGQPITLYRVVANPGSISSGIFQAGGTVSLTDLTPGTSYTFEVTATNIIGQSQAATVSAWTAGACMNGQTQSGYFTIINNQVSGSSSNCSGYVVIPSGVTSIWPNSFKNRSGITSVIITDTVTSIGPTSFYNNQNLRSVEIGNGVTSIGELAFGDTPNLTNLTIGNSVITIGPSAFANSGITSVIIPNSVTTIGQNAFFYAMSLNSLSIGNSVTYIGSGAFQYAQLTSLTIPNSVTTLGSRAFQSLPQALTTYTYCGSSLSSEALDESGVTSGERTLVCPSSSSSSPNSSTAIITAGEAPNSQVATFATGVTQASIPASNAFPGVRVVFTGTAPSTVTVALMSSNPASVFATPFTTSTSTKIVDITLSSAHDGSDVTICLDGAATDSIFHFTGGAWVELPGRSYVNGQVCGVTNSFSPFVAAPAAPIPTPVTPMLPTDKPTVTISQTLIMCTMGTHSQTPTSSVFSLFVDGEHISTNFSAVGDYLPSWITPWASAGTITRTASLTSATWAMNDAYKGKSITCTTLAYSAHATGLTSSEKMMVQ